MKLHTIIALSAAVLFAGCTDSSQATKALEGAGYKNVKITGYAFFGCDKNDAFHTGFEAVGQNGQQVEGVVCSGFFKGATIRTE